MPQQIQNNLPIIKRVYNNGMVSEDIVDEYVAPAGTVSLSINGHFDKLGVWKTRPGTTRLGDAQIVDNKSVKGLFQFLDEGTGTNNQIIAVVNTVAYYLSGTTWTSKRASLTADKKARFTSFLDSVWMVNNSEATAIWSGAAGDNFVTTGSASSAPIGKFIDNFKNRVFIANNNTNPSRLFFSSLPSSGAVTWTTASDFIDISPGDGEDITGIKRFNKVLWVFKENFMYPLYSINETEPDPRIFVGTYSQESVVVAKDGMYWHHPSGIYRLRPGESQPKEISRPIYGVIKNVTLPNYTETASWVDDDHVYTYIGNITLDNNGPTISNCVARWTISTEVWTLYSYPSPYLVGAQYNNGTNIVQVVGDDDGYVYTFNSGLTDNILTTGTPIFYHLETQFDSITPLRSDSKIITKMAVLHENASGAKFGWKADKDSKNEVKPIGVLDGKMDTIFDHLDIQGHRIKFVLSGTSIGSPLIFQGFELLEYTNQGNTE